ncbi:MAG: hypothetical protein R6U91_06355 [Bacillota bacterium]
MFATKCPGQDMRYWTADDVHEENCPNCGELIEFFKTDIRLRCRNCKTRVANPRFDMGCAQWCSHAEMCLGAAAKGLKQKSLRSVLEDQFSSLAANYPETVNTLKKLLDYAKGKCHENQVDFLPVTIAFMTATLIDLGIINDTDSFLEKVNREHSLPEEAVNKTKTLVENISNNKIEGKMEEILVELKNKLANNISKLENGS